MQFCKMAIVLVAVCAVACLWSCRSDRSTVCSDWILTQAQRDSVAFSRCHHYNTGTNFVLKADSLALYSHPAAWGVKEDSVPVSFALKQGEDFVVTEIFRPGVKEEASSDSVWLCLVADGTHLGWIGEKAMLETSSPISPISQFIYTFSDTRASVFAILAALMAIVVCYCKYKRVSLWFVHFRDVSSFYACAFTVAISTASMIYATLQKFLPDVWVAYYFNPSLNPLNHPALISAFLVMVWLSILFLLSVAYDVIYKVPFFSALSYVLSLVCIGCVVYVILSYTVEYYVGYVLYALYVVFSVVGFAKARTHKKMAAIKH